MAFASGTVVNETALGLTKRNCSARPVTLNRWSTVVAEVAAARNRENLTGLASVPELTASERTEASNCCWSPILARSDSAKECRSRANCNALTP